MKEHEEKAIERLRLGAEMSETYYHKPLVLTYSGGKDSDCVLRLAEKAGINFQLINSHTTVDAPETVYHIREVVDRVKEHGHDAKIIYPINKGKPTSMWKLIVDMGMPPTRLVRYCCKILKETSVPNSLICTGVRWEESTSRKKLRDEFEVRGKTKADKHKFGLDHAKEVFSDSKRITAELGQKPNEENAFDCTLITNCKAQNDVIVNPIVDWSERMVWDFLRSEQVKMNPLYERGYDRVGCIGCPMNTKCRKKQFIDYPIYKDNYIKAFEKMIKVRREKGLQSKWKDGKDCFNWWIEEETLPGQMEFSIGENGELDYKEFQ